MILQIFSAKVSDSEPLSAIAFKIVTDPFVGRLAYIRVYSGVLKSGENVYNSTKDERERVGRLLLMHANQREEIPEIGTGGIAAVVGLKQTFTGKRGTHYIVSSRGCTKKKWTLKAKITFAQRADGTPVPAPFQKSTTARCKK